MLLRMLDPVYYEKVDLKNPRRIIRALEICESTGRPYSAFLTKKEQPRNFEVIRIGINRPREELFGRINRRVDEMIAAGLEDEAERLYSLRGINALNSVGYTELFEYFSSRITREQAIGLIKRNSRRYAKRQLTWWNRDREIAWFGADEKNRITEYLSNKINSLSE